MNKDHRNIGLGIAVLSLLLPWPSLAQQEESELQKELEELKRGQEAIQRQIELKQEIEELKKGQADIRNQLQEIIKLLQTRPAAQAAAPAGPNVQNVVFDLADNPTKGEDTAKLTMVEFTDYQ